MSGKTKKKVSFNETLVQVHLIPNLSNVLNVERYKLELKNPTFSSQTSNFITGINESYSNSLMNHMQDEMNNNVSSQDSCEHKYIEEKSSMQNSLNNAQMILNQNQFDALVVFAFNTGAGPSSKVWAEINKGNFDQAFYEWAEWRNATINGIPGPKLGLIRRRNDEIELFRFGDSKRDYHDLDRIEVYKNMISKIKKGSIFYWFR